MKIFISADIEGVSGVVHREHLIKANNEYERARKLMTEEVNAAIQGALEAGAEEILVNDSHGSMRNILIEELNPKARLITGYPKSLLMMEGIDNSFDGAIFIGYHSRANATGVLAHTMSGFAIASIKVNGVEFGETAINAAVAGCFNVPVLMVSGDNILRQEVSHILPDTEFVEVKVARGAFSAECLNPLNVRELIKEKAKKAVSNIEKYKPFVVNGPIELEVKLKSPAIADVVQVIPGITRVSSDTVIYKADDFITIMRMITTIFNSSSVLMADIYK